MDTLWGLEGVALFGRAHYGRWEPGVKARRGGTRQGEAKEAPQEGRPGQRRRPWASGREFHKRFYTETTPIMQSRPPELMYAVPAVLCCAALAQVVAEHSLGVWGLLLAGKGEAGRSAAHTATVTRAEGRGHSALGGQFGAPCGSALPCFLWCSRQRSLG